MRSVSGPDPDYPIAMLTRRARRAWRRAERHIVREHESAVASRLSQLSALQLPITVTVMPETGRVAIVRLRLPGWQILIAGVAPGPRIALSAARSSRLRLVGAGRYGRFWWLSIDAGTSMRVVLLGSHFRLIADLNGPDIDQTPALPDRRLISQTVTSKGG